MQILIARISGDWHTQNLFPFFGSSSVVQCSCTMNCEGTTEKPVRCFSWVMCWYVRGLSHAEHCLWKLLSLSSFPWSDTAFWYSRCKPAARWICLHHVLLIVFHYKQEIFNMYLANDLQKVLCISDPGGSNTRVHALSSRCCSRVGTQWCWWKLALPFPNWIFFVSVVSCSFCAQRRCDCCLLFLFLLLAAVMILGWVFLTIPTSVSLVNELWQSTVPCSVCDVLNEQPLSVVTFYQTWCENVCFPFVLF